MLRKFIYLAVLVLGVALPHAFESGASAFERSDNFNAPLLSCAQLVGEDVIAELATQNIELVEHLSDFPKQLSCSERFID